MKTVLNDAVVFAKRFLDNESPLLDDVSADMKKAEDNGTSENLLADMGQTLERATQNPDTNEYDLLISLAADLLREGKQLPSWLNQFVADVLVGKRKRPTKRGSDKYKNWERDYKFFRTVEAVAQKFDLPVYTNNPLSEKTTAAEVVGHAANCKVDIIINAYKKFYERG